MANNPGESASDEFLEQILGFPVYGEPNLAANDAMMLQLGSGDSSTHLGVGIGNPYGGFPLGLSLDPGKAAGFGDVSGSKFNLVNSSGSSSYSSSVKQFAQAQGFHAHAPAPPPKPMANTVAAPPQMRPRVRARRGQATDPHSIAERLRRERIAEKIRALQELVPTVNKTDRAAMLDEIVDYVKFLRLQVKVLSMSRLGGAGAVAPLVTDIPISSSSSSIEDEGSDGSGRVAGWEKWSSDGTEKQVAKLMEENVGAAMQLLQSKALCIMPISLASAIYPSQTELNQPPPPPP